MSENLPLISIITPSYNQGEFIEETIASIKSQDYPNIEHIVVDGGSKDNTLEILQKYENTYNMRWISEPDKGQADAVNKGFRMAEGEIIGWVNSDDVYFSVDVLSKVAAEFMNQPMVDALYSDRVVVDEANRLVKIQYSRKFNYSKLLKTYFALYQETVFLRRAIIKKHELNADLYITLDSEYWLRIGPHYNFKYVSDFFGVFRVHTENKTVVDNSIKRWNKEKQYAIERYGARRYMIGHGFPAGRLFNKARAILLGDYISYYRLPFDLIRLMNYPQDKLTINIRVCRGKFLNYLMKSITPWLR